MPRLDRASLLAGVDRLTRRDRRLRALVTRFGPPPLWARPAGFATLLRIILEQQVSLASAKALYTRLAASVPEVAPEIVLAHGVTGLQSLGFTRQKASYCCALAAHVSDGRLPLHRLSRVPDDQALEQLMQVPGIGPWTAGIYLLMALRRPDIWPPGDLALHKAMAPFEGGVTPSTVRAEEIASDWRPLRAVAARILWALLSVRPDRSGGVSRGDHSCAASVRLQFCSFCSRRRSARKAQPRHAKTASGRCRPRTTPPPASAASPRSLRRMPSALSAAWTFSTGVLGGHEGQPLVVGTRCTSSRPTRTSLYAFDLTKEGYPAPLEVPPRREPGSASAIACCDRDQPWRVLRRRQDRLQPARRAHGRRRRGDRPGAVEDEGRRRSVAARP